MKNFDWKTFLKQHSIFKNLDDNDIEQILKDKVSEERVCAKGSVIIREGEFSDSVFLIGTGSVQVVLQGKDGYEINISTLGKGEFFGEMAPVEGIRRTATVIARENSTLLEVNGEKFCDIMRKNPIIAFNVLLKLSERLRHVSEHVLAVKLKDADEKINLFNTKLDAELKTVEAHLKASLTVFEQTNTRTSEVINSAERSRARLTTFGSAIGGVITVAIALFSWFGYQRIQSIEDTEDTIKGKLNSITKIEQKINKMEKDVKEDAKEIKILANIYAKARTIVSNDLKNKILPEAISLLDKKDNSAIPKFDELFSINDSELTDRLLNEIEMRIGKAEKNNRDICANLLANSLNYVNTTNEKIKVCYLLLAVLILDNKHKEDEFKRYLSFFEEYVDIHKDQHIKVKDMQDFSLIDSLFEEQDREKRELWFLVKRLIP